MKRFSKEENQLIKESIRTLIVENPGIKVSEILRRLNEDGRLRPLKLKYTTVRYFFLGLKKSKGVIVKKVPISPSSREEASGFLLGNILNKAVEIRAQLDAFIDYTREVIDLKRARAREIFEL